MLPNTDTKNIENEQWGWFIDLESNEKIIKYLVTKELFTNDLSQNE